MITKIAIAGYRSLRDLRLELERLTVVSGPNGSGKSSLYRALRLLADAARNQVVQSLAGEGGLTSTLWAGPETLGSAVRRGAYRVEGTVRKAPVTLKLGFAGDDYGYAIDLGLPVRAPGTTLFFRDPEIKAESVWAGQTLSRLNVFAERHGALARVRTADGKWAILDDRLPVYDSMMTQCGDSRAAPELLDLRERMRRWRFYDHLRTDAEAPARRAQVGTYAPVLDGDGRNLAAAIQTILEIGPANDLEAAIAEAFDGARVDVIDSGGLFELRLHQTGLLRPLAPAELSDGTLRFLMLAAALLSPRPPQLVVLNEPETSLHTDLLPALARLIGRAAARTQVIVVTHAQGLADAIAEDTVCKRIELRKNFGETLVDGDVEWAWPKR